MKVWEHLRTINHHKGEVMKNCFRVGMYKQGLLHDLSKYNPKEFLVGCRYYQGNRSPNAAEREEKGYSSAFIIKGATDITSSTGLTWIWIGGSRWLGCGCR